MTMVVEKIMLGEIAHLTSKKSFLAKKFEERIGAGEATHDENPVSHLCVYFAAYDRSAKKVFMISHKKSGLWLFSGGHVDEGETLRQAVEREIGEEWGMEAKILNLKAPEMLTITKVNNPGKTCRLHYDIWHFIPVDMGSFNPDTEKLAEEAHGSCWLSLEDARRRTIDPNTLSAFEYLEEKYFIEECRLKIS
jgi:8-oxo-dGTP pyrophosphatase MutT (NUDIX family)